MMLVDAVCRTLGNSLLAALTGLQWDLRHVAPRAPFADVPDGIQRCPIPFCQHTIKFIRVNDIDGNLRGDPATSRVKTDLVRVLNVPGACHPLQIRRAVISLHSIFVIGLVAFRAKAMKRFCYEDMHSNLLSLDEDKLVAKAIVALSKVLSNTPKAADFHALIDGRRSPFFEFKFFGSKLITHWKASLSGVTGRAVTSCAVPLFYPKTCSGAIR